MPTKSGKRKSRKVSKKKSKYNYVKKGQTVILSDGACAKRIKMASFGL